jgi:hypothetical protein
MANQTQSTVNHDGNNNPASAGYAPTNTANNFPAGTGVINLQAGVATQDAANNYSAPLVVQIGDKTTPTQFAVVDAGGNLSVKLAGAAAPPVIPATPVIANTAVAANTACAATMAAVAAKTNYLTALNVSTQGGTAAAAGTLSITGLLGGTITLELGAAANNPVNFTLTFPTPLPANAVNVAIVATAAALGATTGACAVTLFGFVQ